MYTFDPMSPLTNQDKLSPISVTDTGFTNTHTHIHVLS